jgi:hypothetical protein
VLVIDELPVRPDAVEVGPVDGGLAVSVDVDPAPVSVPTALLDPVRLLDPARDDDELGDGGETLGVVIDVGELVVGTVEVWGELLGVPLRLTVVVGDATGLERQGLDIDVGVVVFPIDTFGLVWPEPVCAEGFD